MHRTGSENHAAMALIRLIARNLARRLCDNPNSRAGKETGVGSDDCASDGFRQRPIVVTRRVERASDGAECGDPANGEVT